MFIEKDRIRNRFTKASSSYDEYAVAQKQIHLRLTELLQKTGRSSFSRILEIGCGTGGFTRSLASYCQANEWILNDLCNDGSSAMNNLPNKKVHYIPGDAEKLIFSGQFDLIAAASSIQWFNDPAAFIGRVSGQMSPGGILLLNTFGQENLCEIKTLTGKGLHYPDMECIRKWIPSDLEIQVLQEEKIILSFDTPVQVLKHLKYTGVTATASEGWTPGKLHHFYAEYTRLYTDNGKVKLTYQPVYLLAIKK